MIMTFLAVRLVEWVGFVTGGGAMSGAWAVGVAMLYFSVLFGVVRWFWVSGVVWRVGVSRVSGLAWGVVQCRVGGVGGRCCLGRVQGEAVTSAVTTSDQVLKIGILRGRVIF